MEGWQATTLPNTNNQDRKEENTMKYTIDELHRIWFKVQTYSRAEYAAYWFTNVYFPQARELGEHIG